MKTKYRIIYDGSDNYLQYAKENKFLWFKWLTWHYIPTTDYYEWKTKSFRYINDGQVQFASRTIRGRELIYFTEKYPVINVYFSELRKKVKELNISETRSTHPADMKKYPIINLYEE